MRRDVARHRQARGLCSPHQVERAGGGHVGQVKPRPRHVPDNLGEDREVPRHGGLLRRGGPAAQPEDRRNESVVRYGADGLGRVLRVVDERQPQRPGIGECIPDELRRADARSVIGEADDASVGQLAQRRQCLSATPGRDRSVRQRPNRRIARGGGRGDLCQDRRIVERRGRVRHEADGRKAAMSRGGQPRRDRLRVLVARLAKVGVEVDEAGGDDNAAVVDSLRVPAVQPGDRFEDPVPDDDVARPLPARHRVDEPGPADVEVGHSAAREPKLGSAVPASR